MLDADYPIDRQEAFVLSVIERFGYDTSSWRLDLAPHPFATTFSVNDIRITTRYAGTSLTGLFAAMHECGHGLYEHGGSPTLERTPLAGGVSLGLHESQSRLWENLVGRSRPFWSCFFPGLRETFPEALGGVDEEAFYRAINQVRPSLIRVEADEATYNLHVILRFELEQEMIAGRIALRDLPEAWNARMKDYLGLDVPDDARGVLQDIHWAGGSIGYFPTYSLGNVMSVQIWEAARQAVPALDSQIEAGEFGELRDWLREYAPPPRPQVRSEGDAGPYRRRADRRRAVPPLPRDEGRVDLRSQLTRPAELPRGVAHYPRSPWPFSLPPA